MDNIFRIVVCTALLSLGAIPVVAGAEAPTIRPADSMTVSPGRVDLRTGRYTFDEQDLGIGSTAMGGLELRKTTRRDELSTVLPDAPFDYNWNIELKQYRACQQCNYVGDVVIFNQGTSYQFQYNSGQDTFGLASNADFAKLSKTVVGSSQTSYTLTTASGSKILFQAVSSAATATAKPISVAYANGVFINLAYSAGRLASVTSNAGYKLIFEYNSANSLSKACLVNLSRIAAGGVCPAGAQTISIGYTGSRLSSLTDRNGKVWNFTTVTSASGYTERFFIPGSPIPYLTNYWGNPAGENIVVTSQDFADGRHFAYTYTAETYFTRFVNGEQVDGNFNLGTGWSLNGNATTSITFGKNNAYPPVISPTPVSATNELGRSFSWTYPPISQWNGGARILGRTFPEGNSEAYTYDSFRNVTKIDRTPKSGSNLPHIITTSAFGNCTSANLVACDKPTAIVDANGNQTDYAYDPAHGGVVTETGPAVNGIRPVKRYSYAQRYAWISNGAGGFTSAASPIWVKVEERICRTTATVGNTCAGGSADEVVTSYDYGPNSGPNNLWLRGIAVTADGQTRRTCYGYDDYGRMVFETKPSAALVACS